MEEIVLVDGDRNYGVVITVTVLQGKAKEKSNAAENAKPVRIKCNTATAKEKPYKCGANTSNAPITTGRGLGSMPPGTTKKFLDHEWTYL